MRDFSGKADKAKANEKLCLFAQFICKDKSIMFSEKFVKINVIQDGPDGFFQNVNPQDLTAAGKKGQTVRSRFQR